jgi:hypothetical protein
MTSDFNVMNPQYFYDGRDLAASLYGERDGWHVKDAKGVDLGTFPTREYAIAFINAHIADPPAAPLAGERAADLNHVRAIRRHQRQAKAYRARRTGTK